MTQPSTLPSDTCGICGATKPINEWCVNQCQLLDDDVAKMGVEGAVSMIVGSIHGGRYMPAAVRQIMYVTAKKGRNTSSDISIDEILHELSESAEAAGRHDTQGYYSDLDSQKIKTTQAITELLASRVAAARIDELERLTDEQENSQDWERANPGYSVEMVQAAKIHNRIAELTIKGEKP